MSTVQKVMAKNRAPDSINELLVNTVERQVIGDKKGYSGAAVERIVLADGRSLILKRISPETDFSMSLTHDSGRAAMLWTTGMLDRIPPIVDHAMIAAEPDGDGWILLMRDVSKALIPEGKMLSRAESSRIIKAMITVHDTFKGEKVPYLSSMEDHFAILSPQTMTRLHQENNAFASWVLRGWELFAELAPAEVSSAVNAILEQPTLISRPLGQHELTLVHADLYIENIGLYPDRVVMLDWGLATQAPSAVDFSAFLAMNGLRIDASRDDLLEDFRRLSGPYHDEQALQLALIGAVVEYGWRMAMYVREWGTPQTQPQIEAEFQWWVNTVQRALDLWSPG